MRWSRGRERAKHVDKIRQQRLEYSNDIQNEHGFNGVKTRKDCEIVLVRRVGPVIILNQ